MIKREQFIRLVFTVVLAFPAVASAGEEEQKETSYISEYSAHSPQFLTGATNPDTFVQKHSVSIAYQDYTGDTVGNETDVQSASVVYRGKAHNTLQLFGTYSEGENSEGEKVVLSRKIAAQNFFRWHTTQSWYLLGMGGWERNEPSGISNRYILCAGPGYYLLEQENGVVRLEGGACAIHEEQTTENVDLGSTAALLSLKTMFSPMAKVVVGADIMSFSNLTDTSETLLMVDAGITARLSSRYSVSVKYLLTYDSVPVDDSYAVLNTSTTLSFGYTFP